MFPFSCYFISSLENWDIVVYYPKHIKNWGMDFGSRGPLLL
ncbi:hypothetical protein [Bacillus cereus]|nr:hypothetical protein [Bacillus cereus]